jgi:hypothetical protein
VVQSPYIAQVQLLRDRLEEYPVADGVEISTIDSFQGREADAVVISMVRFLVFFFCFPEFTNTPTATCLRIKGLIIVVDFTNTRLC